MVEGDAEQVQQHGQRIAGREVGHQIDRRPPGGLLTEQAPRDGVHPVRPLPYPPRAEQRRVRAAQRRVGGAVERGEGRLLGGGRFESGGVPVPVGGRVRGVLGDQGMGQHLTGQGLLGHDPHPPPGRGVHLDERPRRPQRRVHRVGFVEAADGRREQVGTGGVRGVQHQDSKGVGGRDGAHGVVGPARSASGPYTFTVK